MSFSIHRVDSLGSTVTRQDLYDLINTCTLTGSLDSSSSSVPGIGVTAVTEAPTIPTDGKTWWWDQSKSLMKVPIVSAHGSACSLWLSVGPDSWEIPVLNSQSYIMAKGTLVSYVSGGTPGLYDIEPTMPIASQLSNTYFGWYESMMINPNHRGIAGILQATASPGQIVPMVWKGFCYAKVGNIETLGSAGDYTRVIPLRMSTAYTGVLDAINNGLTTSYLHFWEVGAMLNHPTPAATCINNMLIPAFFKGPWNAGYNRAFSESTVA